MCTSMVWYSCHYPGMLALMLSSDQATVRSTMGQLKERAAAVEAAKNCDVPAIRAIAEKIVLNSRCMRSILYFCMRSRWELSEPLRHLIGAILRGLLNEKLCEDCGQKVRDDETQVNSSKSMRRCPSHPMHRHRIRFTPQPVRTTHICKGTPC